VKAAAVLLAVMMVVAGPAFAAGRQSGGTDVTPSFDQLSRAAEKAFNEARDDDAIHFCRIALAKRPEWEQGLWYLGALLHQKQQYGEARDVLRRFMTLRPDAGPGWALLGISEFKLREYSRALEHLQHAMAAGMGDQNDLVQSVFYHVAILLTRFERYDDSMDMLLRMLANSPGQDSLTEAAGLAGLRLPLLPAEIPRDRRNLVQLAGAAVVALDTERAEDAATKFRQLTAAYPTEPGVHFLYGAYLMQSDPDGGMREMRRELDISPAHVLALVRLADQLIAQRKYDEALDLARQAIKLDPRRASAHMLAGEALLAKGDSEQGIAELENARDRDPSNSKIHWDLLRAYTAAGQKDKADREKQEIEKLAGANSGGDHAQD
jgi:predicted Zn-dependent protease